MAMIPCNYCGKLGTHAIVCPYCGKEYEGGTLMGPLAAQVPERIHRVFCSGKCFTKHWAEEYKRVVGL